MTPVVDSQELTIFTMSDSSGETAAAVARAALVQFPPGSATIYRLPQVKSKQHLADLVRELAPRNGIIAYTLVLPAFKETLANEAAKYHIPTVDLLSSLISAIAITTGDQPMSQPGRLHLLDENYFRKIEAIDFAIRYDDGKNVDGLMQADLILLGVSRTSKTPNCMYLAHHYGIKAANVPVVDAVDPPECLFAMPSSKIIGLHIDPHVLHGIRVSRAQMLGLPIASNYADLERIEREVRQAKKLFRDLQCHVIDVSTKAIEETSSEIYLQLRN